MCNKEICNAYTELNDPVVQRERFQQQAAVSWRTRTGARITCVCVLGEEGGGGDDIPRFCEICIEVGPETSIGRKNVGPTKI